MRTHGEDLDAEGMPDLDDSLPQKEMTGDAQEGLIPPADHKQARDDIYARDTLEQRLKEELPDRLSRSDDAPHLMDPGKRGAPGRERHRRDRRRGRRVQPGRIRNPCHRGAGGVVDRDVDSYTGEPIP